MGGIDLDPASNSFANQVVKAKTFYTENDDGLEYVWKGRVFLNPPYKHPAIECFVDKLLGSNVDQAVLLTNSATDTGWWHKAASAADAICFPRGRISFYQRDGVKTSPTHGQTFFYYGPKATTFGVVFSEIGLVR